MLGLAVLYPWFLAGLAALGVPLALHLWRPRAPKQIPFPALRFLQQAVARRGGGMVIERRRLLLLRLAALTLIVLAFARPTLRTLGVEVRARDERAAAVIVLDTSASMAAVDNGIVRFDRALRRAREILDNARPGDEVALILAEMPTRPVVRRPTAFLDTVRKELETVSVAPRCGDVAAALAEARAILRPLSDRRRDIYLISDLQVISWAGVQPGVKPDAADGGINLYLLDVGRPDAVNAAPVGFETAPSPVLPGFPLAFRWNLQEWGGGGRRWVETTYTIGDAITRRTRAPVEPAARSLIAATHTLNQLGYTPTTLTIESDALPLDNTWYDVVETRTPPRVVLIDGVAGPAPSAGVFIEAALRSLPQLDPDSVTVVRGRNERPAALPLLGAALVIVVDVSRLDARELDLLTAYIDAGGSVWFALGGNADVEFYNRAICGRYFASRVGARVERPAGRDVRLYAVDWKHPLFRNFDRDAGTDFSVLRFRSYFQLQAESGDAALAGTGEGDDLLIERRHGEASVFLSVMEMHPTRSFFVKSPLLVPFLGELVEYCDRFQAAKTRVLVGEAVDLRVELEERQAADWVEITTPGGAVDRLEAPGDGAKTTALVTYQRTDQPGIYHARLPGRGRVRPERFAVNLDRVESDLATLSVADAAARLADYRVATVPNRAAALERTFQRESGLGFDGLLALLALGVCVGELLFANHRTGRA